MNNNLHFLLLLLPLGHKEETITTRRPAEAAAAAATPSSSCSRIGGGRSTLQARHESAFVIQRSEWEEEEGRGKRESPPVIGGVETAAAEASIDDLRSG